VIGLDTNVVIRYLAQDEPRQAAVATRLFEKVLSVEQPGFVSLITLCEIGWVLAECYAADKIRIRGVVEGLLASRQIVVEESDLVWKALRTWQQSTADFSDALIGEVSRARGCERTVTFDKTAAKLPGFELLV
jgi:predicted nucleic-acid-binding protein